MWVVLHELRSNTHADPWRVVTESTVEYGSLPKCGTGDATWQAPLGAPGHAGHKSTAPRKARSLNALYLLSHTIRSRLL